MNPILVTGGAGYVGSVCCAQLLSRGFSVEVVDDLSAGHADAVPQPAVVHRLDVGDRDALESLLAYKKFDVVFHFAAKALISQSVINPGPFFDANVASGVVMLETLRRHGIRKFVFSSSAAVYGSPEEVPTPEDHVKEPVNAYGESKLIFEQILKWYAASYGWSVVVFRYFNACGGERLWGERHDPETHIIPLLLQTASGRREYFEIYGTNYPTPDGTCLRDYVHVLDIAEAHILALQKMELPGFHAYNIGTGRSHSVREVCQAVEKVTQKRIGVRHAPRRPGDPAVLCASPRKLVREFAWEPRHSELEEIIMGAWEWEQAQCEQTLVKQGSR
ncbi:MAG: UDP-glucose 4-epimerase GalE [Acidobacteria bacterium 13_1_20CM_2_60_10]|nr:MAG: UDP-glucose 4-epimerase GalE [Acidobacteria bacterium 13_1_20CM_2_60_10]